MQKVLTIIGARPQFIKAAPLSKAFASNPHVEEIIVHTGQHFDPNMSEIFFSQMGIPKPKYSLSIHSLGHGAMTGRMLEEIEKIILEEKPHVVLVFGDTNSTLAGALAAKKLHVKVAHVEAGLRSFNMRMPEEVNRILTDRISDYLFCPTQTAVNNLMMEGYEKINCSIVQTGDIMLDAMTMFMEFAPGIDYVRSITSEKYALCTIHRAENTDNIERLRSIVEALNVLNETIDIVVPLHPRTFKILKTNNIHVAFKCIEPVGYFEMLSLLKHCEIVLTDSGGLQKEAYMSGKFCVTLRDETEWVELIENDVNVLVGADKSKIIEATTKKLQRVFDNKAELYGNGNTATQIVDSICNL